MGDFYLKRCLVLGGLNICAVIVIIIIVVIGPRSAILGLAVKEQLVSLHCCFLVKSVDISIVVLNISGPCLWGSSCQPV